MTKHISVFTEGIFDRIEIASNATVLDVTLGGGGHSLELLRRLKGGVLISFDVDVNAITTFKSILVREHSFTEENCEFEHVEKLTDEHGNTVYLVQDNFESIAMHFKNLGLERVSAIIADLGWSSDQLEHIPGLSFERDEDGLDMRLDNSLEVQAKDLLNALGKRELKTMFEQYADIYGTLNTVLVEELIQFRKRRKLSVVGDLKAVLSQVGDKTGKVVDTGNTARVFQAIRIAVNDEYSKLQNFLHGIKDVVARNGYVAMITFHSGESKIVEQFITDHKPFYDVVTDQNGILYIRPTVEELRENLRARSAKLYVMKRK